MISVRWGAVLWCLAVPAWGQAAAVPDGQVAAVPVAVVPAGPVPVAIGPGMARVEGVHQERGITFARVYINQVGEPAGAPFDLAKPTLAAQCELLPDGKYSFELLVNAGGVTDTTFYPPWKKTQERPFRMPTGKVTVTMEFLGYMHVKPVKRQFEELEAPKGQMRYNTPGMHSGNMEDISFYLQYLRALPTLRLTYPDHVLTFETTPLLAQVKKEPLCVASRL